MPFEEGEGSKDRPCLLVHVSDEHIGVLKMTSTAGRPGHVRLPTATWDPAAGRDSSLQLHPVRWLQPWMLRRPLGLCDAYVWSQVQAAHRRPWYDRLPTRLLARALAALTAAVAVLALLDVHGPPRVLAALLWCAAAALLYSRWARRVRTRRRRRLTAP